MSKISLPIFVYCAVPIELLDVSFGASWVCVSITLPLSRQTLGLCACLNGMHACLGCSFPGKYLSRATNDPGVLSSAPCCWSDEECDFFRDLGLLYCTYPSSKVLNVPFDTTWLFVFVCRALFLFCHDKSDITFICLYCY